MDLNFYMHQHEVAHARARRKQQTRRTETEELLLEEVPYLDIISRTLFDISSSNSDLTVEEECGHLEKRHQARLRSGFQLIIELLCELFSLSLSFL